MADGYTIEDDSDLKEVVRGITMYEDSTDELEDKKLDTQVRVAKLKLSTKVDSADWYEDDGLSLALIGATCILAKCAVENYSITRWDIGGQYIDVSGVGDTDQPQLNEWNDMVTEGLSASSSRESLVPSFSKTYIGQ